MGEDWVTNGSFWVAYGNLWVKNGELRVTKLRHLARIGESWVKRGELPTPTNTPRKNAQNAFFFALFKMA